MLGNLNMSALALTKARAMPCNEANKDAIIMEIKKEFQEMSDAAKYAAQDYKRTKAFDSAIRIDLQAARAARSTFPLNFAELCRIMEYLMFCLGSGKIPSSLHHPRHQPLIEEAVVAREGSRCELVSTSHLAFCTLHILPTLQVRDSATAIPMPDLSTPSSSSPQPGLCGPSDKEYSTR